MQNASKQTLKKIGLSVKGVKYQFVQNSMNLTTIIGPDGANSLKVKGALKPKKLK